MSGKMDPLPVTGGDWSRGERPNEVDGGRVLSPEPRSTSFKVRFERVHPSLEPGP